MQPIDPRTDEEKIHAADLQEMGLNATSSPRFEPGMKMQITKYLYEHE